MTFDQITEKVQKLKLYENETHGLWVVFDKLGHGVHAPNFPMDVCHWHD